MKIDIETELLSELMAIWVERSEERLALLESICYFHAPLTFTFRNASRISKGCHSNIKSKLNCNFSHKHFLLILSSRQNFMIFSSRWLTQIARMMDVLMWPRHIKMQLLCDKTFKRCGRMTISIKNVKVVAVWCIPHRGIYNIVKSFAIRSIELWYLPWTTYWRREAGFS